MSICVISQPRFFPGLHYLHRMMLADLFVILDTVQFNPRHEENRTKLKAPQGPMWLTAPIRQSGSDQLISDTLRDRNESWGRKSMKTLECFYSRAPYFKTYAPEVLGILEAPHQTLIELDRASWQPAIRLLGITCEFVRASELPVSGKGPELLFNICQYMGMDIYLSGAFGKEYLDVETFRAKGVEVLFHDYSYEPYPQRYGDFVPFLSYLDTLFNVGLKREYVLSGGKLLSIDGPALTPIVAPPHQTGASPDNKEIVPCQKEF